MKQKIVFIVFLLISLMNIYEYNKDSNGGIYCVDKTSTTINNYLTIGSQLWMRANKVLSESQSFIQPTDFVSWLKTILPELKPATRRQYIASSRQWLDQMKVDAELQSEDITHMQNLVDAMHKMANIQSSDFNGLSQLPKPWKGKTSSQKAKKLSLEDMKLMIVQSKKMKGKWLNSALIWLNSNSLVGLRPIEWQDAVLSERDEQINLVVQNAKNTNGRANGNLRHINLSNFSAKDLQSIRAQISNAHVHSSSDESWKLYYDGVRKTLYRLARKTFKNQRKYPTLYSSRHQFAANAKSVGMSKAEVAALMGHAVDDTAGSHYGKKKHGRGVCNVLANVDEVASVRQKVQKSLKKPPYPFI